MSVSDARLAHESRHQYTVLAGDPVAPFAFIEIVNDYFGVGFLDQKLREDVSYQFQEKKSGKLFLTMATHREFDENTDQVIRGSTYIFDMDGKIHIEQTDFGAKTKETSKSNADVSSNWEDYPEFGNYDAILKRER